MALRGHWYPTVVTLAITSVLLVWSLYALAGAGVIRRLPFLRAVLSAITGVYLLRGVAFLPMLVYFPGRSTAFWLWSSGICLAIGLEHPFAVARMLRDLLWQSGIHVRVPTANARSRAVAGVCGDDG